jgi:hypothetical protein
MNTAKQINKCLDDMLALQAEAKRLQKEVDGRKKLVNQETGEKITKKQVLELAEVEIIQIKNELNKLTNNGKNVKGLFNNEYYVNDMIQDKLLVQNNSKQNFNK